MSSKPAVHDPPLLLSVNVGQPQVVAYGARSVSTAIWKFPVAGRIRAEGHQLAGDRQADLRVHGGPHKAVYLYPSEHYGFWRDILRQPDLPFGAFGENLTTSGLLETDVLIGDSYRFGSAILRVTQPRMPCFKLGIRFNRSDMVKLFWRESRSGIYFSIVQAGELAAGDRIELVDRPAQGISVRQVVGLYSGEIWDSGLAQRALKAPLYGGWKEEIGSRLMPQ